MFPGMTATMGTSNTHEEVRMKRTLFACLASLATLATSVFAAPPATSGIVVIHPRKNFPRGMLPETPGWQVLACASNRCELRPADMVVKAGTAVNVLDEEEPVTLMEPPAVDGATPVAWFHGMTLPSGAVTTWHVVGQPETAFASRQLRTLLRTGLWTIPGPADAKLSWVKTPEGNRRYHLSAAGKKQFLLQVETEGHYGGDTTPVVHWAGDLDGDGLVDLLIDLLDDNCGFDERLYLSKDAGPGKLVRKAAQVVGREAACGC